MITLILLQAKVNVAAIGVREIQKRIAGSGFL